MTQKTVSEILQYLVKTSQEEGAGGAPLGSEAQAAGSGAAAIGEKNQRQSEQEGLGGANISANTVQIAGNDDVATLRELVKDKLMHAAGADRVAKQEGDPEAKLNFPQDLDAANTRQLEAGGEVQVPPGATERPVTPPGMTVAPGPAQGPTMGMEQVSEASARPTAQDVLSGLFDALSKESSSEDASELVKTAGDMVEAGRWVARGFWDELTRLASETEPD